MRLREIRGRAAQHLDFLLEEFVPATQLSKFFVLRTGDTGLLPGFDAFLPEPFLEGSDVDAEVFRNLHERDPGATVGSNANDVIAELFRETRGHSDDPSRPAGTSHIECHLNVQQTPSLITGTKPITSESVSVPDKPEETPAAKPTTTPEPKESPRVSEEPEEAEKPEKTQTPEPTKEPEIQPGLTDDEKSAMLDEDLKFALFVESSYQELLAVDPSLWGGYLVGVRVEGSDAYFTLQVDRSTPEGKDLGQRAAQALSTLLTQETVDELGISWVIVEDGAGVVIDQKMSSPLI